jgi:regulator of sigma E protease
MGLMKGDKIVAVNGRPVDSFNEFTDQLARLSDVMASARTTADSLKVRRATIVYARGEQRDTASVVLTPDLKLGYVPIQLYNLYQPVTIEYGFLESIPAGIRYGWNVLASYVDDMKYVFTAEGAKSVGGFGAIGSLFPPVWDWYMFWKMTAFLSIILAFMNILPIPALDGGHVLFLLYEMITRRKPSEEFMVRAEYVGFGLLMLLMVFANLNDILRWLGYM